MPRKPKKTKQRSAVVTLRIGADRFTGKSSGQYGHAEMEALRKFIRSCTDNADAESKLNAAATKTVKCPNQPVCNSCRIIMKALDIKPAGGTTFSREQSGGVSWGGNLVVESFMKSIGKSDKYAKAKSLGQK